MKNTKIRKYILFFLIFGAAATAVIMMINSIISRPIFSSTAKTKHLVVISIDALNAMDYDQMVTLPHFKEIMDKGSYAREVVGIYPSLTYPSHTSIITGTYPDKHGIYANEVNEPGVKEQRWYWYNKDIKVPTLYDIAKKSNMKVGILFWPVSAGAKVDYNLPEIWTVKDSENQTLLSLRSGTPLFIIGAELKYGKLRDGKKQPNLDNYTAAVSSDTIRTKKPNLMLIHLTELDHERHKHGVMSDEAKDALKRMDDRIGQIIQSAVDAGIYDDTTFVVLGDHGFLDINKRICINTVFAKEGLINVDSKGKVTDWKAYVNYCDGSAQVYLKDQNDKEALSKVGKILYNLKNDPDSGIEALYTKEQAAAKKVSSDFLYMLEAKKGYAFSNDWEGNLIVNIDKSKIDDNDDNSYCATHGYDPLKPGYRTFFMACGAGIKKGVMVPSVNIVDEGPTMAKLLGLNMPGTDGKIIDGILK
jgi:predicted AlkP superfamily pyrophosphatase or phosphodiesterase